jgi:hypothetical protein
MRRSQSISSPVPGQARAPDPPRRASSRHSPEPPVSNPPPPRPLKARRWLLVLMAGLLFLWIAALCWLAWVSVS